MRRKPVKSRRSLRVLPTVFVVAIVVVLGLSVGGCSESDVEKERDRLKERIEEYKAAKEKSEQALEALCGLLKNKVQQLRDLRPQATSAGQAGIDQLIQSAREEYKLLGCEGTLE